MARKRIVAAAFDGIEVIDLTGPMQVFTVATRLLGGAAGYDTTIVAAAVGPVTCAGGTQLVADRPWASIRGPIDTVLVPGALAFDGATPRPVVDPALVAWLRGAAVRRADRVASVCVGAHILAAAGWLDGRRATTHWATLDQLAETDRSIEVDRDAIFVRDGHVWTSAGATSGIDLALALVALDHGEALARQVAAWLVMYLKRPGGQSQFSAHLLSGQAEQPALAELQRWIPEHLSADLSVAALAARANMSERHFARTFRAEVGIPPARYVERMRTEAVARQLLDTALGLDVIARRVGFGSVETLHRSFRARFGVAPGAYRSRFRLVASPVAS